MLYAFCLSHLSQTGSITKFAAHLRAATHRLGIPGLHPERDSRHPEDGSDRLLRNRKLQGVTTQKATTQVCSCFRPWVMTLCFSGLVYRRFGNSGCLRLKGEVLSQHFHWGISRVLSSRTSVYTATFSGVRQVLYETCTHLVGLLQSSSSVRAAHRKHSWTACR